MSTAHTPGFFTRGLCLLVCALLATSCTTRSKPDADWNSLKIWRPVANNPPTYVPTGYGGNQPRTDGDGTWFTDKRDGKRIFVPKQPVRGWEHGVLVGEAKKVTGYDGKPHLSPWQKICWSIIALFAAMGDTKVPLPD